MADITKQLEVAEIRGCCWLSIWFKVIILTIRLLKIANSRRKEYGKRSPWSGKVINFGCNIKLLPKEKENEE